MNIGLIILRLLLDRAYDSYCCLLHGQYGFCHQRSFGCWRRCCNRRLRHCVTAHMLMLFLPNAASAFSK